MLALFRAHGELCATRPWEVIVAMLMVVACALAVDREPKEHQRIVCGGWADACSGHEAEYHVADAVLMTIIRCLAILYAYYQVSNLLKLGSKNILAIAGIFTMFSTIVFTSSVINILSSDFSDLKDALFLFVLLTDVSKASLLARLALSAESRSEVRESIGRGVEMLGPSCTLDSVVEALLVGVGMLSGVPRLVTLSWFACVSVIVNYIIFMTLYPACLSLVSEFSNGSRNGEGTGAKLLRALHAAEEEQKPNPAVQQVKLIMSVGLLSVHLYSRWSLKNDHVSGSSFIEHGIHLNRTDNIVLHPLVKWLTSSVENFIILILVCALAAKFVLFEDSFDLAKRLNLPVKMSKRPDDDKNDNDDETSTYHQKNINSLADLRIQDGKEKKATFELSDFDSEDKETQTEENNIGLRSPLSESESEAISQNQNRSIQRSESECLEIYRSDIGARALSDTEVIMLVKKNHIPLYKLEDALADPLRGVKIRRRVIEQRNSLSLEALPYLHYDYSKVLNTCCENVIGHVGIPVGFAGPMLINNVHYMVPMATTEGALVASTNRGAKALSIRGITAVVEDVGMTRAPVVSFPSVLRASEARKWIEKKENYDKIKEAFDATSRFARLQDVHIAMDGPQLYIRFRATTGDAMGMNMVSKGAEMALSYIKQFFDDMDIISLSGNYCSDKKPAAINWIKGRGKRVVCEATIDASTLQKIFKTDAKTLVRCNKLKNLSGSAMAGTIGGNNAHAANMVTAIFIATGQDPAQNVTSSNCSTSMEVMGPNEDLYMTCTMPSLEVGTVGGGTILPGQAACLEMLGVKGAHVCSPGDNSKKLAQIICATVLAGELSLMAALVNNDLVRSHMRHNRSSATIAATSNNQNNTTPRRRISLAPPNINSF